jgi:2-(1,2-epoxy-1,2-dihydrophenyl)acetyl-CoA isomerase
VSQSPKTAQAGPFVLETRHEGVATLVMNRPDRLNALNNELAMAVNDALVRIAGDTSVAVVVISGAGRAFCAGGDLGAMAASRQKGMMHDLEPLLRAGMQMVLNIRTMPQPVIAAVNGAAAGAGMNVVLAADIRIAAEEATFGQNFGKVGLFPDFGGTYFLPQLVGTAKAAELFYTGDMIDAKTALSLGIVNHIFPAAQLEAEVKALAQKIARGPLMAIRAVKKALFASHAKELAHALNNEVEEQIRCYMSEDCGEGIKAFFEKRPPKFQGK